MSDQPGTSWEQAVEWLRSQPDQQELVRAGYYDDPLSAAADRYWHSEEWRSIRALLPCVQGASALDIGAGRGIASYALAMEGYRVVALEPDPSALVGAGAIRELAELTRLPIAILQERAQRLPFADSSFDLVFGRAVLHHVPDMQATCREVWRVLKPGGVFVAVREHVISRDRDLTRFHDVHPLHRLYGGEAAFRLNHYVRALQASGLEIRAVLAPLRSPINLAPQSIASLRGELALRATRGVRALAAPLHWLLRRGALWKLLLPLLESVDHRPGRLYSFVTARPAA
jgi:ubiquinone/menaquinone biosynthesis C-methylase UbiE